MNFTVFVNNTHDYAKTCKYIIARYCDGEFWFYGADDDKDKAYAIAAEVNGMVFFNETV